MSDPLQNSVESLSAVPIYDTIGKASGNGTGEEAERESIKNNNIPGADITAGNNGTMNNVKSQAMSAQRIAERTRVKQSPDLHGNGSLTYVYRSDNNNTSHSAPEPTNDLEPTFRFSLDVPKKALVRILSAINAELDASIDFSFDAGYHELNLPKRPHLKTNFFYKLYFEILNGENDKSSNNIFTKNGRKYRSYDTINVKPESAKESLIEVKGTKEKKD